MYSHIKGVSKAAYSSITEGIGQSRITKNIEGINFDGAYKVSDQSALNIVYDLIREEGLFLGPSSGIIAGAIKLASIWVRIKQLLQYFVIMLAAILIKFLIKNTYLLKD